MSNDRRQNDRRIGPADRRQGDRRQVEKKALTVNLSVFIIVIVVIVILFTIFSISMLNKIKNLENNQAPIVIPPIEDITDTTSNDEFIFDTNNIDGNELNDDEISSSNDETMTSDDNTETENETDTNTSTNDEAEQ